MTRTPLVVTYGWLAPLLLLSRGADAMQRPTQTSTTAFTHVAVIPMGVDTNRVLTDQTVVVRGGRIVTLGPVATTAVPAGAQRIDGRGKYLIPGLADMHAHVGSAGGGGRRARTERELFLFVANGVTTVRSVNYIWPDTAVLDARARAAAGTLWSPRIYAAASWRDDEKLGVMQALQAYQAAGYDFIKLHGESGLLLDSIAHAARLLGIPFMGHVEDSLSHALALHYASIEHLTGYPGGNISPESVSGDTVRLPEMIAATQRSGVWNCPTQSLYEVWWDTDPLTWPENQYAWPHYPPKPDSITVIWGHLRHRIIKALQDAGAGLLLGTDAPLLVPGFGVHRELQALVRSGLTPYQALATGTQNVAAYFGTLRDEGTVTVGKVANLVLLNGNPLDDIRNTTNPAGVMVRGRWLSRPAIDRGLKKIAADRAAELRAAERRAAQQQKAP